jgi:hypothetical protein
MFDISEAFRRQTDPFRDLFAGLGRINAFPPSLHVGADVATSLTRLSDQMRDIGRVLSPTTALATALEAQFATWRRVADLPKVGLGMVGFEHSFAAKIAALGPNLGLNDKFALRILAPEQSYTSFVDSTSDLLEGATEGKRRTGLETSLSFASKHFEFTTQLDSMTLGGVLQVPSATYMPPVALDLYVRTRDELLELVEHEGEAEQDLVSRSKAAAVSRLVAQLLRVVHDINLECRAKGRDRIFPPTDKFLLAYLELPQMLPADRESLGDAVDHLFFVLYEGAGDDKLRFDKKHGGLLEGDQLGPVFLLKFLRNKWLRHDIEHGEEAKVRKAYRQLAGAFDALGLGYVPRAAEEYYVVYSGLLSKLLGMLETVLDQLRSVPFPP